MILCEFLLVNLVFVTFFDGSVRPERFLGHVLHGYSLMVINLRLLLRVLLHIAGIVAVSSRILAQVVS